MKLLNKLSLPLLSASLAFAACERDYDAPPLSEPEYTGSDANTTIAQLRELASSATSDVPFVIADDLILKAYVSGNDESGNIYKTIYLQDNTGAIPMLVDQSSVYNYYSVGQEVYVALDDLCISVYGSEQQIGHPDGYLYRTPWEEFQEHVSKNGWANPDNVQPIVLSDISTVNTDVDAYRFMLVQFTGVYFENGGVNTYAEDDGYGEENIVDSNGNTLTVRTSNYADFAGDYLPTGTGNVTGILGRYNGSWQLLLRTIDDVSDFTEDSSDDSSDETTSGVTETVFEETFSDSQGEFTIDNVTLPSALSYVWSHDSSYGYMKASAYVSYTNYAAESWLISPAIDLIDYETATLTFMHIINYASDMQNEQTLWVADSSVTSGSSSEWKQVTIPNYPSGSSWTATSSGDIDLSAYTGNSVRIAFRYTSTDSGAATWELYDVKVTATTAGSSTSSGGTSIYPDLSN